MTKVKFTDGMTRGVNTRREIIEIWAKQNPNYLDSHCCPFCRDILFKNKEGIYSCANSFCSLHEE